MESTEVSAPEKSKRKRRRKKGKGGAPQAAPADSSEEPAEASASPEAVSQAPHPVQKTRSKLDPEKVAKLALKIYLAEVSEEGVALIGDNDAKELSRRCFRLAEIFMEEHSRHA